MKKSLNIFVFVVLFALIGCGGKESHTEVQIEPSGTAHWVQVDKVVIPPVPLDIQVRNLSWEVTRLEKKLTEMEQHIEQLEIRLNQQPTTKNR